MRARASSFPVARCLASLSSPPIARAELWRSRKSSSVALHSFARSPSFVSLDILGSSAPGAQCRTGDPEAVTDLVRARGDKLAVRTIPVLPPTHGYSPYAHRV